VLVVADPWATALTMVHGLFDWGTRWPTGTAPIGPIALVPVVGVLVLAWRHAGRLARFRWWRVFRALTSRRYFTHKSHVLDVMLLLANLSVFALIIGQAVISMTVVGQATLWILDGTFGPHAPSALPHLVLGVVWFVALFLAYEFAYWLDHTLCHTFPSLWEFHKVHHSAEVLSPITNFRVHPIDSLVFANIVMVCNGLVIGTLQHIFGGGRVELGTFAFAGAVSLGLAILAQMQHSHVWLPFTGWLGRVILSPAHHQIHHSTDPAHHNKNMGNFLAIFDWAAGTLHIPSKKRPKLVFGVDGFEKPHDFKEAMLKPFADSARHLAHGDLGVEPQAPVPVAAMRGQA
jgi:sterol desaturase/sphingolipid hydroxylase (fatty acid hydroxylase superfamily)